MYSVTKIIWHINLITVIITGFFFCNYHTDKTKKHYDGDNHIAVDSEQKVNSVTTTTTFNVSNLFGIWTTDPNGPHADFMINKETYLIVDNEGQSEFPYEVKSDTITITFPDYVTKGIISKAANDTLVIKWDFQDPITYVRWKNYYFDNTP